jgi:hypothetical protein
MAFSGNFHILQQFWGWLHLLPFCWVSQIAKNGWIEGWVEVRSPTIDIGMFNPTYE